MILYCDCQYCDISIYWYIVPALLLTFSTRNYDLRLSHTRIMPRDGPYSKFSSGPGYEAKYSIAYTWCCQVRVIIWASLSKGVPCKIMRKFKLVNRTGCLSSVMGVFQFVWQPTECTVCWFSVPDSQPLCYSHVFSCPYTVCPCKLPRAHDDIMVNAAVTITSSLLLQ